MPRFLTTIITITILISTVYANDYVSILYFNDGHEIAPVSDHLGTRGGVARLKTQIDNVKAENNQTIVAFGGDLGGGVLFGAVYHGFPMVEAYNKIPIDIASFGQHDFDFGLKNTVELIDKSEFQWFTSNLKSPDGLPFANLPKVLIFDKAEIKVGFIGLTDAMNTSTQDKNVKQEDLFVATRKCLKILKEKNVDYIILLTQTSLTVNEELLVEFPDVDAVFSEERSENRSKIDYVGNRPIMSPCGNQGSIVRLDLHKNGTTKVSVLAVDETVSEDKELADLQTFYMDNLNRKLNKPIATLLKALDAGVYTDNHARFSESNAGNLIADAYRNEYNSDIAIINGGGIRANADSGSFTMKDALSMLPFNNKVCLVEVDGKMLNEILEHGVSDVENYAGRFCQVSGLKYSYSRSAASGNRIKSIVLLKDLFSISSTYTVALPSHLLTGGDGFSMLTKANVLINPSDAPTDITVFSNYCKSIVNIKAEKEGRIKVLE